MPQLRPLEPFDAQSAGFDSPWIGPSGGDVQRLGLWLGGALVGAVRLTSNRRLRQLHSAQVHLRALNAEHADALLAAVTAFADGWTPHDRLQLALPADHPALSVAAAHGFAVEVRRVDRSAPGCDEIGLGRLRPGFAPRPPGPPPAWPPRLERWQEVTFRPPSPSDAESMRDLSIEATAVWGTLQTPWSNAQFYADRYESTAPGSEVVVVLAEGAFAGSAGLHPAGFPGVYGIGMAIAAEWQGGGLGGQILDQLIRRGRAVGGRRLELGVWHDNSRARALYETRGFVAEGLLRCDSIRGGGHASSLEMALLLG